MQRQKQRMHLRGIALAAVLLVAAAGCENAAGGGSAAGGDSALVGTWKASGAAAGNQSAGFSFYADGSCTINSFIEQEPIEVPGTWRTAGRKLYLDMTQRDTAVGTRLPIDDFTSGLKQTDNTWISSFDDSESGLSGDVKLTLSGNSFTMSVNIDFAGIMSGTGTLIGTSDGKTLTVTESEVEMELILDYSVSGSVLTLSVGGQQAITLTKQP